MTMADAPQTDMLHLSLSEISALSCRAIRGAGRSWGEAEEGADAACWLARAGLDWAGALTSLLRRPLGDSPVSDAPTQGNLCPLRTGMMLADFACLPNGPGSRAMQLSNLCDPVFMLPFLATAASRTKQRMKMEWVGARTVITPDAAPWLEGAFAAAHPVAAVIVPVSSFERTLGAWPSAHRAHLTTLQYQELCTTALNATVPNSTSSQTGAGAQGNDND